MTKLHKALPHSPLPRKSPEVMCGEIKAFLSDIRSKIHGKKIIIGISGGIDSATSLNVIAQVFQKKDIIAAYLPYFQFADDDFRSIVSVSHLPSENIHVSPITEPVDEIARSVGLRKNNLDYRDKTRLGNIMARVRMIHLFDLAKKLDGVVCGTENRSEYYLGYFTRYGDAASDIEPIAHLFKTEVRVLATYLGIPEHIVTQAPTAGLWDGQTDEVELGFSYEEADQVLYYYFDQKKPLGKINAMGYKHASEIITRALSQSFKREVPYRY